MSNNFDDMTVKTCSVCGKSAMLNEELQHSFDCPVMSKEDRLLEHKDFVKIAEELGHPAVIDILYAEAIVARTASIIRAERLDRPELREKIAHILLELRPRRNITHKEALKQILALIPDVARISSPEARADRGKIAKLEYESRHPRGRKWEDVGDTGSWKIECYGIADQILALIPDYQPDYQQKVREIIEEVEYSAKVIWAFVNKEKGKDDSGMVITLRDMVHDMVVVLKSKYIDNPLP